MKSRTYNVKYELEQIMSAAEAAIEKLEQCREYQIRTDDDHAAAVSFFNRLDAISIIISKEYKELEYIDDSAF